MHSPQLWHRHQTNTFVSRPHEAYSSPSVRSSGLSAHRDTAHPELLYHIVNISRIHRQDLHAHDLRLVDCINPEGLTLLKYRNLAPCVSHCNNIRCVNFLYSHCISLSVLCAFFQKNAYQERLSVLAAPRMMQSTLLYARLRSAEGFYRCPDHDPLHYKSLKCPLQ